MCGEIVSQSIQEWSNTKREHEQAPHHFMSPLIIYIYIYIYIFYLDKKPVPWMEETPTIINSEVISNNNILCVINCINF